MLEPNFATVVLLSVGVLLLIVIPILDGSSKFSKYISLRYTLVAVSLMMSLGCILDFSHLSEESRRIVLLGGLVMTGIFIVLRSLEKMKLGNKVIEFSAEKGDIKVGAKIGKKESAAKLDAVKVADTAVTSTNKKNEEESEWEPSGSVDISCLEDERGGEES